MINKVVLVGRLANMPKSNQSNQKTSNICVTFPLAIERGYKPKDENAQTVDFLHCKAFNKTASNILQYCKKGSTVCITGQIHSNRYQKQGEEKAQYFTEIVVENIKFLPNFGVIKTGDVLPQTPDEIWNELSDAEKTHAIMIAKETAVKQFISEHTDSPLNTEPVKSVDHPVVSEEESRKFIEQLDSIKEDNEVEETSPEEPVTA
ncbi:single-stranded DNA-binding protein [Macrococcus lamae]|uniref:Single-stranded DNA-binding protein n=1 Tax=Macrococcus lamae TaxID=198484 RepID=A0A4R6BTW6_9STAP|nr:single-stranded DNA-binding protein [Macrococcus lamae]TDM10511.1 single-stranded DNA-binding protein [Macrococcus lamae]